MHVYREEGFELEVKVLKDESDSEWLRYTLEVLRVLRESTTTVTPKVGETFDCAAQRDCLNVVGWYLAEIPSSAKTTPSHSQSLNVLSVPHLQATSAEVLSVDHILSVQLSTSTPLFQLALDITNVT